MRIEEINVSGFKRLERRFVLGKLNLFQGDNGAGKSGTLLAAQYAIEGRTPLGDKPEASYQLVSAPSGAMVGVVLDDGFSWSRSLAKDHKSGTVSQSMTVSGSQKTAIRDLAPLVNHHVGEFAEMFDLTLFTDVSAEKQRAFVLDLCGKAHRAAGVGVDVEGIVLRITRAFLESELGEGTVKMAERMHKGTPAELMDFLLNDVAEARRKAFGDLIAQVRAEIRGELTESIGSALNRAKAIANATKADRDKCHAAVRKLEEQRAGLVVPAAQVDVLKANRATLITQREDIFGQIENQRGRQSSIDSLRKQHAATTSLISELEASVSFQMGAAQQVDVGQAVAIREKIAALPPEQLVADLDAIDAEVRECDTKLGEAIRELRTEQNLKAGVEADLSRLRSNLERARENPWQKALDLLTEYVTTLQSDSAVILPASLEPLHKLITAQIGEQTVHKLLSAVPAAELAYREIDDRVRIAVQREAAVRADQKTAVARRDAARAQRTEIERANAERRRRIETLTREADDIERRALTAKDRLEATRKSAADQSAHRLTIERQLSELESAGGMIPLESLETQRTALTDQIAAAEREIDAKVAYQALEAEIAKTTANAEAENVRHEVAKALCEAIRALRESLMGELVAPLIGHMNRFLAVAAHDCRAYCDLVQIKGETTKAIFEIGWIEGVHRVPLHALSGAQSRIFGAALAYALVRLANPPLKLLLIEADGIRPHNMVHLLAAIEAVADEFDNVLIATSDDRIEPSDLWTVHTVGAPEPEMVAA